MDIVLISGKQGSGKSTTAMSVANLAMHSTRYGKVLKLRFAGPLYELHDLVLDRMQQYTGKAPVPKDGVLLQLLGTEWGRAVFGPDVWVTALKKQIEIKTKPFLQENILIVVDDCRFENEFHAFPNALRVRLRASQNVRKKRTDAWRDNTMHPSETGLDKFSAEERFDLYLQTDLDNSTPDSCATLIMAQLDKRVWIEKRKQL